MLCAAQLAHGQEAITEQQFRARIDGALPELQRFEAAELAAKPELLEIQQLPPLGLSYEREEVFVGGQGVALKNSLSLDWSLDVSGSRGKRSQSAELRVRATEEQNKYARKLVLIDALKLYNGTARARLRVASLASTRAPLATLVEGLANRAREGDASGYDLARFELELADHDELLTEARSEELVAEAELAALLNAGTHRIIASDDLALPTMAGEDPKGSARSDVLASQFEEASGKALASRTHWWHRIGRDGWKYS